MFIFVRNLQLTMHKFLQNTLIFMLSVFLFTSCDKDVTGVTYVTHLKATSDEIIVNDSQINNTNMYNVEWEINLENEETRKYSDQISDFKLEKISLYFNGLQSLAGNQTPTHLIIGIDNDIEFEFNDFVYDTVATGEAFQINDQEKLNEIAELLFSNKIVNITMEGEIPDTVYHQFTIEIDVLARIEVETP